MAEAVVESDWCQTAALMAQQANLNRDPAKTRPYSPADFNPTVKRDAREPLKVPMATVKRMLLKMGLKRCKKHQ
jgi:hypothetical protein